MALSLKCVALGFVLVFWGVTETTAQDGKDQPNAPVDVSTHSYPIERTDTHQLLIGEGFSLMGRLDIQMPNPTVLATVKETRRQDARSNASVIGIAIGAGAGAILSIVLSDHSTGSSGLHPLFVLGGALIGFGVGTAF